MKEIKINIDKTINIVNPEKYYVLHVIFSDNNKRYYILKHNGGIYEFDYDGSSPEHTFHQAELQKCIEQCLRRVYEESHSNWVGHLYQFNSESEFEQAKLAGLL